MTKLKISPVRWKREEQTTYYRNFLHLLGGKSLPGITSTSSLVSCGISASNEVRKRNFVLSNYYIVWSLQQVSLWHLFTSNIFTAILHFHSFCFPFYCHLVSHSYRTSLSASCHILFHHLELLRAYVHLPYNYLPFIRELERDLRNFPRLCAIIQRKKAGQGGTFWRLRVQSRISQNVLCKQVSIHKRWALR